MLDLHAIEAAVAGTVYSGKIHLARVTESTNREAMEAGRKGAPHGSVWLAEEQTAGRGRGDHRWLSAAGQGLYVSVLLRPQFPPSRLPLLPIVAGLAAAEAIRATTALSVDLRWPNDLLIGPRKAGGILCESAAGSLVVGIGINVHQGEFPPGLDTPATSLDIETGVRVSRHDLLIALLNALESETAVLADPSASTQVPARLMEASTWIKDRYVDVHGPQACTGITAGLDASGFLLVETAAGLVTVQTGGIRAATASSR